MKVRIVTDSSCDLPPDVITRYGICVVPLYINIGGQGYLDGIDITRAEFYKKLPTIPIYPTTAVPSPQKFHAIYDALAEEGASQVLSIHISTSLSSTVNVAQVGAQETKSVSVTVFDSRQLSLGSGFLVERAASLAQAGCSVSEMLPLLNEQISRTHVFATLDTLKYLRRSGRMNSLMSSLGELVHIKPLIKMYDGKASAERIPTRNRAMKRLIQLLYELRPLERVALIHTDAADRAQALQQEVEPILPAGEIWSEQINPVLGAHIGPGVVGFACVSTK
jgi:DegV family protein with EDD domain